ncbi:MAG: hypothetical protein IJZ55_02375 [Lachnospiraceae bacterium]|nr:hypothetical protein [Lachnospiraceae bacterium]
MTLNADNNQYTKCYVAFLDLLGFRNTLINASCEEILNVFKEINKNPLVKVYRVEEGKTVAIPGPESLNCKIMSDSICFYIEADIQNALFCLLSCCAIFQAKLLKLDTPVLVRGAIVLNDLYAKDDVMFGKGLSQAYELEEKSAKYPRIIFTKETYDLGEKGTQEQIQSKMSDYIFCDEDEYYCVDYLPYLNVIEKSENAEYCKKFYNHIIHVLSTTTDSSIRDKYVYLKKYFYRTFGL